MENSAKGFSRLIIYLVAVSAAAVVLSSCTSKSSDNPVPEQMRPLPPGERTRVELPPDEPDPPHVKLRKNKDNSYSWEISGDDVEGIVHADKKLRDATADSRPGRPGRAGEDD